MNGFGRWWWLEKGQEHARCTAERKDPYLGGRCKNKAVVQGLCRAHARLVSIRLDDTPEDLLRRLQAPQFRQTLKQRIPPTAWKMVDLVLDQAVRRLQDERQTLERLRPKGG